MFFRFLGRNALAQPAHPQLLNSKRTRRVPHLALPTAPLGQPAAAVRGDGDKLLHVLPGNTLGEDAAEENTNSSPLPLAPPPPARGGDDAVTGNAYEAPSTVAAAAAAAASSFLNPTPPDLPLTPLLPPLGLVPTRW